MRTIAIRPCGGGDRALGGGKALGCHRSGPALVQCVNVEELVPRNHFLRKVDAVLDLSFVRDALAEWPR